MQISVVIPVYKSAAILSSLVAQIHEVLSLHFMEYELILVNDCSPDGSWEEIESLARRHKFIVGLDLRKNVGQDNAIMAGLNYVRGRTVVIMDDDLQHSPQDIPLLCAKISEGHDVCYAYFEKKKQALWKNAGSWLNDQLANWVIGKPAHIYLSPFKAISGGVVAEMIGYRGPFAYVDGLIWNITSRCTQVTVRHHPRAEGVGNYDLVRSITVWLKLFTGFSAKPLRIITWVGFTTSCLSILTGIFFLVAHFLERYTVEGWASLFVSIAFLSGVQLTCLGVLGEYVGRTYLRLSDQPQFSARKVVGGVESSRIWAISEGISKQKASR